MRFSERKGIKVPKSIIQIDSMDNDLRNSLWNELGIFYWSTFHDDSRTHDYLPNSPGLYNLVISIWQFYFKKPLDEMGDSWQLVFSVIRQYFFQRDWYEVYDFIEFIAEESAKISHYHLKMVAFMIGCNNVLERELSAYRFVGGKITQITSDVEISSIEQALNDTSTLKPVHNHLKSALDLLSDRKNPDYRNSIKESISAVEAICGLIAGKPKVSLGDALNEIERKGKIELHPALKKSFNSLYGYTSNSDGIRHALLDEPNLAFDDAKFMLVSCSAFINYLTAKSEKAGIKL